MNQLLKIGGDGWAGLALGLFATAYVIAVNLHPAWCWLAGLMLGVSIMMCWIDILLHDLTESIRQMEDRLDKGGEDKR